MFHGVCVDSGAAVQPLATMQEECGYDVARAVLIGGSDKQDTVLYVAVEQEMPKIAVAVLNKSKPQVDLDLGFESDVTFTVEGPGKVHISGNLVFDEDDEEDDEEDEDEEEGSECCAEQPHRAGPVAGLKKLAATMPLTQQPHEADSTDDGEEDEDDNNGSGSGEEDSSSDEDDEAPAGFAAMQSAEDTPAQSDESGSSDEDEEPEEEQPKVAVSKKRAAPSAVASSPKKKEKLAEKVAEKTQQHHEKPKHESKAAGGSTTTTTTVEDQLKDAVCNYLKKNGQCTIGQLGAKVQKPSSLNKLKWGQFLKKYSCFKVNGQNVSLAN